MKRVILIIVLLLLVGGGVGGFFLFKSGKLPFLGKKKSAAHAEVKKPGEEGKSHGDGKERAPAVAAVPPPAPVKPKPVVPTGPSPAELKAKEMKIAKLASIYDQMSPDESTPLLAKLPDPLVLDLLNRMDEKRVAKILVGIDPKKADRLTRAMAK
jgi:hypothetical protein